MHRALGAGLQAYSLDGKWAAMVEEELATMLPMERGNILPFLHDQGWRKQPRGDVASRRRAGRQEGRSRR